MKVPLTLLLVLAGLGQPAPPAAPRFDLTVRADFFAGFAGDTVRLKKAMDICEQRLAEHPDDPEPLVWHGSGLAFEAGAAFRRGDRADGASLWTRGLDEMDRAVAAAPDDVGVRLPRGATLLQSTQSMSAEMARPLLETAVGDYERVLQLQASYFSRLDDHSKGELLFGLAEGYSRLGQPDKARAYFSRLLADAPGSGEAPKARRFLDDGALPPSAGRGCVGCHQ